MHTLNSLDGSPALSTQVKQIDFTYDVLGRRMQKVVTDSQNPGDSTKTYTRKYVYNGDNIFAKYDENIAKYAHAPLAPDDILAAQITSDGTTAELAQNSGEYYYLKDALGSVTSITNSAGALIQKYDYSMYGKVFSVKDSTDIDISEAPLVATSFAYTGLEFETELGLYYYRARYYDPQIGRFLQKDPDPGRLNLPATITNKYVYVNGQPTIYTDPTGRIFGIDDAVFIIGMMVVGGFARDYDRKGGSFFDNFLAGAIDGLIAAAVYSATSGAAVEAIAGNTSFISPAFMTGLSSPSTAGATFGTIVAAVSAPGMLPAAAEENGYEYEGRLTPSKEFYWAARNTQYFAGIYVGLATFGIMPWY